MWKAILRFSRKSVMVVSLFVGLTPITAPATIQLKTWQSYGGMVEQGAICAAFSRLMELQNLALQQKIDILESAATPASVPANTPDPVQQAPKMAA
jgi:hypothetical protein